MTEGNGNWIPIGSMYGIFTNIYPINDPNVGKYTIHGSYGIGIWLISGHLDASELSKSFQIPNAGYLPESWP